MTELKTRNKYKYALGALVVGLGTAVAAMAQTAGEINISGYPGTIGGNFNKAFVDTFEGHDAIRYVESWDSARFTQMQANRNNPRLDLVTFTDLTMPLAAGAGLLDALDESAVPNLADVQKAVRTEGDFGVPFTYGCQGIVYNAKYVKEPITSWADLLRDDLKGHVSAPNVSYSMAFNILDALSQLEGGSLKSPEAGMKLYRDIRTSGPGLWDQENVAVGWLKTGEIWATPYFSGNALGFLDDADLQDLRFVVPQEGAYYAPLGIAKVHGAPGDRKDIDAFINHVLSPEAQAQMSKLGRTRPVNEHAEVSEAIAASCPLASELNKVDIGYLNENRSQIIDQWNQSVNN